MKLKQPLVLVIILILIMLGAWKFFSGQQAGDDLANVSNTGSEQGENDSQAQKASLVIINGVSEDQTFEFEVGEETTAFSMLREASEDNDIELSFQDSEFGVFIEKIGPFENGNDGKYWLYYINGEMPQVAADKHQVEPGDKVEFRFVESPF